MYLIVFGQALGSYLGFKRFESNFPCRLVFEKDNFFDEKMRFVKECKGIAYGW